MGKKIPSGKTTICLAAMGYVRPGLKISSGNIHFDGIDVLSLRGRSLRDLRGKRIAYVAQSASAAFNPGLKIESQVKEPALIHRIMGKKEASARAIELYEQFKLPDPKKDPEAISSPSIWRTTSTVNGRNGNVLRSGNDSVR